MDSPCCSCELTLCPVARQVIELHEQLLQGGGAKGKMAKGHKSYSEVMKKEGFDLVAPHRVLTAAVPVDKPYCSCKLTWLVGAGARGRRAGVVDEAEEAQGDVAAYSCKPYGGSLLQL